MMIRAIVSDTLMRMIRKKYRVKRYIKYITAIAWSIPWVAALGAIVLARAFFSNMYVDEFGEFLPWSVYVPQTVFSHFYLIIVAYLPLLLLLYFEKKRS